MSGGRWRRPLLLAGVLWAAVCAAEDPFAMFESAPASAAASCCPELARCRTQLRSLGPLRALCATRRPGPARRPPSQQQQDASSQPESVFMRRHVARTLRLLGLDGERPPESETVLIRASLTQLQVVKLRQYLSGAETPLTEADLAEADDILEGVMSRAEAESVGSEVPGWLRRLGPLASAQFWLVVLCAGPPLWLVWAVLSGRSWYDILSRALVMAFLGSCLWHWQHLYLQAAADRQLKAMGKAPAGCDEADSTWTGGLVAYLRGYVSFARPQEACREYYKSLTVDPFWDVSPVMAVSETLARFVLHPTEPVARSFGVFYRAMAEEVPTLFLLPAVFLSFGFLLTLVVIACRYRPAPAAAEVGRRAGPPRHVRVLPGDEEVHLLVSPDGDVHTLGEPARRRTLVGRPGASEEPEPPAGWLPWAGRGLLRSGAAAAAGLQRSLSAGALALVRGRSQPLPALPDQPAQAETPPEPTSSTEPGVRAAPGSVGGPGPLECSGEAAGSIRRPPVPAPRKVSSAADVFRSEPPAAGAGGDATPDRQLAGDAAGDVCSEPVTASDPAAGGDSQPGSPFLDRIREVMDTSQ